MDSRQFTDSVPPGRGKRYFAWHAWLGFKLSILMLVICASGAIATVSHEIDWLLNPMLRVEPQAGPVQWQAMQDSFQQAYPGARLVYVQAPLYANFAAIGLMMTPEQKMRRVFFNPYTGDVTGDLSWYASVQRVARDLHRFLLIPSRLGLYIVGIFGLALLASAVTALFVYKKWWRGFFRLRLNRGRRIFFGDLHRLIGVWSLWFLFVISITGTWYLVEEILTTAGVPIYERAPLVQTNETAAQSFIPVSAALAAARADMPDLKVKVITFAADLPAIKQPYIIAGQRDAVLVRNRSNQVVIDPFQGTVLDSNRTEQAGAFERWTDTADPLHFGNFAGLGVKLIWFFFGLLIPVMSLTGTWMWLRRSHRARANGLPAASMGWWKPASLVTLAAGLCFGGYAIWLAV